MNVIFISEKDKNRNFKDKIIAKIKYIFNKIDIVENNKCTIYYLPINLNKKIRRNKIKKLSKNIIKNLENEGTNRIVLSNNLKGIEILKNSLYRENINILNGRYLFKCISLKIIEYILNLKKEKIENSEICILVNDFTDTNKEIIIEIAKSAKRLKIITNNISKCKRIEKYLNNEFGILLDISNNMKTSLLRERIILNLDFPEELINKYRINNKAIIMNTLEKIEIQSKKFNGININYFKIKIPEEYKIAGFKNEEIYESKIFKLELEKVKEVIEKDKIEIEGLIGNRGIIQEQEFRNY